MKPPEDFKIVKGKKKWNPGGLIFDSQVKEWVPSHKLSESLLKCFKYAVPKNYQFNEDSIAVGHNPQNLTNKQVGENCRLANLGDIIKGTLWTWDNIGKCKITHRNVTYRVYDGSPSIIISL